jgi:four helix bundle protein
MELAKRVYGVTAGFPDQERFGLTNQLRRAAVSVPSNVAEGQGRASKGEFRSFIGHARGSLYEAETQIRLAVSLGYLNDDEAVKILSQASEVGRLLNGMLTALK